MEMLKRFFAPPVFDNEEKNNQASTLNLLLWVLVFVPLPYLIYVLTMAPNMIPRAIVQTLFGETVNIVLLIMLRQGFVKPAAYIQVLAFWFFLTATSFSGFGVRDEAYLFGYPLVILIAGLLISSRAAFVMAGLSLLAGLGMVYAEYAGILKPDTNRSSMLSWVTSFALFPVIATLQYLTSRMVNNALKRARLSEEKYRLISRVSSDYAFESKVDAEGNAVTIWLGGAIEKMTGYTPEEYIASGGWYAHIHPDDLEKDNEDMKTLMRKEDVLGSEIRTFTKNGEIRWERVFAHPIWSEEEDRLIGILGAVQDITEQKEAERKLQETLHQQEAILNNIPDMAWLKDINGQYIAVNEQYLQICGKKKEDVIGKTDLDIWDKLYAERYLKDDLEVIKSGVRKTIEELQKDGSGQEYWVETTKTPIYDEKSNVIGTTGIARNISERKTAEMERERFITELAAKNAELERFTYTVSHDLKSPLVTITGFLGYIERDALAGKFESFSRDIQRIRQAVGKMQTLLNDLLELSRIGRMINEPVETDFGSIVRDALSLLDGLITARQIRVSFIDEGDKVFGDRVRLLEVMQNLLENAIKFMGNQPQPHIRVGTKKDGTGNPIFFVQDNGIGIETQYQDRIFGLFNKLDANTEGTGIGLTLVKRIIELHNGTIWLDSEPGKGTTIYFTLPGLPK